MELNASTIISLLAALCSIVLGYLLREKDMELKTIRTDHAALVTRVGTLETKQEVQAEANRHRDDRSERIEHKLDRLLDKLGA